MDIYRGKKMGSLSSLKDTCRQIIESGSALEITEILPHIQVLRDDSFFAPLCRLLEEGDLKQRMAAASALGSLGDSKALERLRKSFFEPAPEDPDSREEFEYSIIEALGDLPSPRSVEILLEILRDPASESYECRVLLVIESLGRLAQQGVSPAESRLTKMARKGDGKTRSRALAELSLAYWHRPEELPEDLLDLFVESTRDESGDVTIAALAALSSLAQLGSDRAGEQLTKL